MNTKSVIQSSANVIRVTNLKPGDIYKRYDAHSQDYIYYGIVKAVNNNGEKCFLESVEYRYSYSGIDVKYKSFTSNSDSNLNIFPCEVSEFNLEFDKCKSSLLKEIKEAEEKIVSKTKALENVESILDGTMLESLTKLSYKELSQAQYEEKKKAIEVL